MTKKRHTPERIVTLLRQVEVAVGNGEGYAASLQRGGDYRADVLPLAERIRGAEAGPGETAERARKRKLPPEARRRGAVAGEAHPAGGGPGKLLSPERRRATVVAVRQRHGVSERHACRLLGQWRGTQRYRPTHRPDEEALTMRRGRAGQSIRPVWLSAGDRVTRHGWVARGQGPRGTHLAPRGAESTAAPEAATTIVAQRRVVWPLATAAGEPRVELRLRQHAHARRADRAPAHAHRRVHAGVSGDPRRASARQ